MTHDRILIVTDDNEPAHRATMEAVTLAKELDAALYALYVLEALEPPPWFNDPAATPGVDTKAGRALDGVTSEAADRGYESDIVTAVVRGETAPAILEYADQNDIDLIVMGTHGRTGLDRLVIGEVAEEIVRESPVPVLTVRPE